MKSYFFSVLALAAALCLLVAPACRQQPQTREYEENSASAAAAPMQMQTRPHSVSWRWERPLQWREEESAGLRLATFSITSGAEVGQCTLITLPGDGGGVQANVQRWLDQLHLPLFSQPELDDFLSRQKKMRTVSGLPVTIIDFASLNNPQDRSGTSLLVAVITGENQTLFVKMSGEKALLEKNREVFNKFSLSLSPGA
jgi:hypothetical protein